jgi:hypothetical protein
MSSFTRPKFDQKNFTFEQIEQMGRKTKAGKPGRLCEPLVASMVDDIMNTIWPAACYLRSVKEQGTALSRGGEPLT